MPDFRSYIRENLTSLNVTGEREAEIVEELVVEFEESYERALRNGAGFNRTIFRRLPCPR
jgi:hypothetical protein